MLSITHNALFAIWQLEVLELLQMSVALHTVYAFLCIFNVIRSRSPISRFLVSVCIRVLVQLVLTMTYLMPKLEAKQ